MTTNTESLRPLVPATKRWVTVLSPTLTGNAVFRTQTITKLLREQFNVQLIAFESSPNTFGPLERDDAIAADIRYYAKNVFTWWWRVRSLRDSIRGEAIVSVKPMLGSFGAALLLGRWLRRPVIADIDDWELGFLSSAPYWEFRSWGLRWFFSTQSPLHIRLLNGFTYRATAVTVSNSFLQGVYGGHWIPHARNQLDFGQGALIKAQSTKKKVLFGGSPRGHKGLPTLLRAWQLLRRTDAELELAVPEPHDTFLESLRPQDIPNVLVTGPHHFQQMPTLLAGASVVVVPQDNLAGSVGQLPAKLIDAMAAGRPIVATDVGDARRWLDGGAGVVVAPGSDQALADGISFVLDHPDLSDEMGKRARARFLRYAAESALAPRMCEIVSSVLDGHPMAARPAFDPSLHEATTDSPGGIEIVNTAVTAK